MIASSNRRLSIACSSSHIRTQFLTSNEKLVSYKMLRFLLTWSLSPLWRTRREETERCESESAIDTFSALSVGSHLGTWELFLGTWEPLCLTLERLWGTLGSLGSHLGATWESLWHTWGSLWGTWEPLCVTLEPLWGTLG